MIVLIEHGGFYTYLCGNSVLYISFQTLRFSQKVLSMTCFILSSILGVVQECCMWENVVMKNLCLVHTHLGLDPGCILVLTLNKLLIPFL